MRTKHADRDRDAVREQADREGGDALISDDEQEDAEWLHRAEGDATPPRLLYAEGAEGDAEWCKAVDAASAGYGKSNRAQSTANEHDLYAWSFNQYAIRQGFGSFLERCGKDEWHRSGSLRAWGCS